MTLAAWVVDKAAVTVKTDAHFNSGANPLIIGCASVFIDLLVGYVYFIKPLGVLSKQKTGLGLIISDSFTLIH